MIESLERNRNYYFQRWFCFQCISPCKSCPAVFLPCNGRAPVMVLGVNSHWAACEQKNSWTCLYPNLQIPPKKSTILQFGNHVDYYISNEHGNVSNLSLYCRTWVLLSFCLILTPTSTSSFYARLRDDFQKYEVDIE